MAWAGTATGRLPPRSLSPSKLFLPRVRVCCGPPRTRGGIPHRTRETRAKPGGSLVRLVMAADTALVRSDHAHQGEKCRRLVGKDAQEGSREADNLHIPPRPGSLRSRSTHAFPVTGACFLAWYPVSLALLCPAADKISFSFFLPFSFSFFLSLSLSFSLFVCQF